jgi:hypothetical protein
MSTPETLHTVHTLHTLQHEFARHVTRLDTGDEAITSASRDSRLTIVEQLRSDRGIAQAARLAVYRHGYFARIHDVLRDDFGALHALFGAAAFHDLAKLYLMAHPPRSHSLRDVGASLPAFFAGPVAEPFATRWPWAADLATLEWALVEVFDAPDRLLLDREALSLLPPAAWAALELELVPAHRILALEWPVHRLRQAWSNESPLPALDPSPTTLLVHRHREQVFTRSLGELEQRALALVGAGCDLAAICGRAADELGDAGSPTEVLALLERWLADGLLAAGESTVCASRDR